MFDVISYRFCDNSHQNPTLNVIYFMVLGILQSDQIKFCHPSRLDTIQIQPQQQNLAYG